MRKNCIIIQDGIKECGSACLLSIIRYYGGNVSMPRLLELTSTTKERTNFILASHNGSSSVSYFNNLSKMHQNDIINIYYNGIKYIYKYYHSYEVLKTGEINIERDKTISTITLITCKENDDNHQVVYLGYLINTETY